MGDGREPPGLTRLRALVTGGWAQPASRPPVTVQPPEKPDHLDHFEIGTFGRFRRGIDRWIPV